MSDRDPAMAYCSFCGKAQDEVLLLVASPVAFICDECIELCIDLVMEKREKRATEQLAARRGGIWTVHRSSCLDRCGPCVLSRARATRHREGRMTPREQVRHDATPRAPDAIAIIHRVCEGTGITPDEVLGERNFRRVVEVRHRAMRAMRSELKMSFPAIGRVFGCHHTTVAHGCGKIDVSIDSLAPLPPYYMRFRDPIPLTFAAYRFVGRDEHSPLQRRCHRATETLKNDFGHLYSSQNRQPERQQLRPPAWS